MLQEPLVALDIKPSECDFVDYGAGKGRVVMLAMTMGFRTVTGVELSEKLCEIALINLARFSARHQGIQPGIIAQEDAGAFTPTGRHIVAYLYNPFGAAIMQAVRTKLEEALLGGTDRVTVIYVNPEHHYVFGDAPNWARGPSLKGIATFSSIGVAFHEPPLVAEQ